MSGLIASVTACLARLPKSVGVASLIGVVVEVISVTFFIVNPFRLFQKPEL